MKRKQTAQRIFSGLLAAGICVGMAAPVAYAEEALPVTEPTAEEPAAPPADTLELPEDVLPTEDPAADQHEDEPAAKPEDAPHEAAPEAAPETEEEETADEEFFSAQAQPLNDDAVIAVQDDQETPAAAETYPCFQRGRHLDPCTGRKQKVCSVRRHQRRGWLYPDAGRQRDRCHRPLHAEPGRLHQPEGRQNGQGRRNADSKGQRKLLRQGPAAV